MRHVPILLGCLVAGQLACAGAAMADHDPRRNRVAPVQNPELVIRTPWTLDIPADLGSGHRQVGIVAGVDAGAWAPGPRDRRVRPPAPNVQLPPITVPPDILAAIRRQLGLPLAP
jgi:hypothetical protein